jgi:hypothetical protein
MQGAMRNVFVCYFVMPVTPAYFNLTDFIAMNIVTNRIRRK